MTESIRILYVGLDAETAERITAALEDRRDSIDVETAANSTEAVDRLEAESFDCVVSSDTLPDRAGIELLRTVRESFPALPFVLFADTLTDELVSEAIDAGVTDYLPHTQDESRFSLLADRVLEVVTQYRATERTGELERVNTVIRDLNRELVRATTRDEVDQRVCEIISDSDPYVFAWVGDHDPEAQIVTGRAAAGVEEGYLEAITITTGEEPTAQGPTGEAIRTHEIQVMQNILENPAYEPWQEQALERGYRSSAAIPLEYEGTLYGVLNVYSDRTHAFDTDEQELLEELGDTIAYAHHEIQVHEEARQFQRAVEQAADAIFITDTDGTIEYVNPAFEALTGFSATEATGSNSRILKSGEQPEEYYETMWETILDGEIWESEIVNVTRSGDRYHAEQTVAPLVDESDDIEGFVAIQRDITERKERERELERSKKRLQALFDRAPEGILVHDIDGTIFDVNEMLIENLGYSREELLSMEVLDIEVGTDEETVRQQLQSADPESVHKVEVEGTHQRRDGSTYPAEIWISRVTLETQEADQFISFIRDITERKERERELHRREAFLEQSRDIVTVVDAEGTVKYQSESTEEVTGFSPEEILGEQGFEFIHPEDREKITRLFSSFVEHRNDVATLELRVETRDGSWRWIEARAVNKLDDPLIEGIIISSRDVTQRKERELQVQALRNRLELAIETADAGVWELDIQTEEMIYKESMETLLGLEPGTFEDSHESFIERVHPEDRETVEQIVANVLEKREGFEQEFRLRHESGDYIWVLARARLFTDSGDSPDRIIGVAIDVSDRIDRTRQLRVMDRVLRHNLRNDMTTIQGYAETVRTDVEGVAEEMRMIIEKSQELMQTVDKEREIVEIIADPPDREEPDVVGVCQQVVAGIRERYPEATLEFDHPEEASGIATEKLGRGIEELLENAIVHNDQETPELSLTVEARDETVRVEIADNGPGIPTEEVDVLTHEYEVDPLYHGSGLGLWLVNWIVRQADGTLSFEENDPRGSIITIELQRST